jgi:beta-phosphoglucomutase-like phosphatase (HAD superfamily)
VTALDPLRRPGALLLDLDGTLIDTVAQRVASWVVALGREGISASPDELGPLMGGDGRWVARQVAERRGITLDRVAQERIDRTSGAWFEHHDQKRTPTPGARELLLALDAIGLPWAIATSSLPEQTTASVAALGLPRPPTIVDASHVRHAKPAPDLLLAGASQLRIDPVDVWYVGDARWDMLAAVAADMVPVGVLTGATDADGLRDAGAAVVVTTLADLHVLLRDAGITP